MYLLSVRLNPQLRNAITYCNRTGKHFSGGLQKCEKRLLASPCPFVRMKQLGSHCTNFDEIWYSSFFSRQSVKKVQASVISTRITSSLHEDVFTSVTISRWIIIRIRNASDKSCRENQNTHFIFNNFSFRKSCRLWDNVKKLHGTSGNTNDHTIWRMHVACWISKATHTHAHAPTRTCIHRNISRPNIYCICTTMVSRTRLNITLYEHCLSSYTRWFKYDRDWLCVNKSQFVPVIFEPPCIYGLVVSGCKGHH